MRVLLSESAPGDAVEVLGRLRRAGHTVYTCRGGAALAKPGFHLLLCGAARNWPASIGTDLARQTLDWSRSTG